MAYERVVYETDKGTKVFIRVSDKTIGASGNTAATGTVTDSALYAFASNPGSKRKKALNARGVVLYRLVGTAPNQFKRLTFLPIFTKTVWDNTEDEDTVTVNSVVWKVQRKVPEA